MHIKIKDKQLIAYLFGELWILFNIYLIIFFLNTKKYNAAANKTTGTLPIKIPIAILPALLLIFSSQKSQRLLSSKSK